MKEQYSDRTEFRPSYMIPVYGAFRLLNTTDPDDPTGVQALLAIYHVFWLTFIMALPIGFACNQTMQQHKTNTAQCKCDTSDEHNR